MTFEVHLVVIIMLVVGAVAFWSEEQSRRELHRRLGAELYDRREWNRWVEANLVDFDIDDNDLKIWTGTPQQLAELDAEGYVVRQPDGSIMIGTKGEAWK